MEAAILGRNSIGADIDPVAVFVSRVKTSRPNVQALRAFAHTLLSAVRVLERPQAEYERRCFKDITVNSYKRAVRRYKLSVPAIPNIFHWFRRYVLIDLARLRRAIYELEAPRTHKDFFLLCFASIIRASSNADPVPVSGLEVTAHMKRLEADGRVVNPFGLFRRSVTRSLDDVEQFRREADASASCRVIHADSTRLSQRLRTPVDVVITSPPYHNAVDYYRRHTLEMYWLNLVSDQQERLMLLPRYIGRPKVPQSHPFVQDESLESALARKWERRLREVDDRRGDSFRHYTVAMRLSMAQIAKRLPSGKRAIFVVGKSRWNDKRIPTTDLFEEIGSGLYRLEEIYWYPLKNRYMSYSRHDGVGIDREYVLVLKRTRR